MKPLFLEILMPILWVNTVTGDEDEALIAVIVAQNSLKKKNKLAAVSAAGTQNNWLNNQAKYY